jgi:flagellar biosynthesis protein FlhA
MPGKQMSIDADLSAGIIDEREAIKRRLELRKEADFYGAMDGASKFVQGDVRVGLLITLINIIGGILVGTLVMNMDIGDAFNLFILLTIGDGLVAAIPSLLLSTATGILVTRSVSDGSLGEDLGEQLTASPMAFGVGAFVLLVLSFIPGFPTLILLFLAIVAGVVAFFLWRAEKTKEAEAAKKEEPTEPTMPESTVDLVNVDPFVLEIGFNLIPFADEEQGRDLLERIKLIRKTLALEMGLVVPTIRIIDNLRLRPSDYSIKINGVEVGKGSLKVNKLLAIPSVDMNDDLEGEETLEPVFKTKAKWIDESLREKAESLGYSVVDPPSIIATHITEVIKKNATEIMDVQKVKEIIDSVRESSPTVVDEALKAVPKYNNIQKILHNLLSEGIGIRNMVSILETIADYGDKVTNIDLLTEYVRQRLAKQISEQFSDENDRMIVFTLDPGIEHMLEESLQETDTGFTSTLSPEKMNLITRRTSDEIANVQNMGYSPIVLTSASVRPLYKGIIDRTLPDIVVLSYNEITKDVNLEHAGTITLNNQEQAQNQNNVKKANK